MKKILILFVLLSVLCAASCSSAASKDIGGIKDQMKDLSQQCADIQTKLDKLEKMVSELSSSVDTMFNKGKNENNTASLPSETSAGPWQEKFSVTDLKMGGTVTPRAVQVTGVLKNLTSAAYAYVDIRYNIYDADGAQVASGAAVVDNLESNGTFKFTSFCFAENANSVKIAEITYR